MLKLFVQRRGRKKVPTSADRHAPYGVTVVEVLLVLSVIFLNVAIFLPLVNSARESSRRTQCQDNLKQLGMAVWQYHESHRSFPAGFEVSSNGSYLGWGWSTRILPHLNAPGYLQAIEPYLTKGIHGLPQRPEFHQGLPSFSCPSDVGGEMVPHAFVVSENVVDGVVSPGTENWSCRFPRSNYFGNVGYLQVEVGGIQYNAAGTPTSLVPLTNAGSLGNTGPLRSAEHRYCDQKYFGGYFGQNSRVKAMEVHDGTSNTIMIGERYSPADSSLNAVGYGTWIGVPDCIRAQFGDVSGGCKCSHQYRNASARANDGVRQPAWQWCLLCSWRRVSEIHHPRDRHCLVQKSFSHQRIHHRVHAEEEMKGQDHPSDFPMPLLK